MITGVFARLKPLSFKEDNEYGDPPVAQYFNRHEDIIVLGRLYNRRNKMPDLYLTKKTKKEENGVTSWAALESSAKDVEMEDSKYESYDGNPLSFHAKDEQQYMWLMKTTAEIITTKSAIARRALQQWDD